MDPQDLPTPSVPETTAQEAAPPPPKRDSFVMSFVPKKDFSKYLPVVLILVLVASLPLAVFLVRQRTQGVGIKAAEEGLLGPREKFFVPDGLSEDPQTAKAKMLEAARANPTISRGYLENFEIPQVDQPEENTRRLEDFLNQSPFNCEDVPEEDTSVIVNERGNLVSRFLSPDDLRRFREQTGRPLRRCRLSRGRPITPSCGNPIGPEPTYECLCEKVEADKDLSNLTVGELVKFTGFGKTNYSPRSDFDPAIGKIKFIISKNGTVIKAQEVPAAFDREEGGWRFYKGELSYTIEDYGDYTVAIQVTCPQGWQD